MNLLVDTCAFLWLASDHALLSAPARRALADGGNEYWLSEVSILEITLKWTAQKLGLPRPPRRWVEEELERWQIARLPLRVGDIYRMSELPRYHQDPFDRLLVAQALEHGLTVLTPDAAIARYPVDTLW